MIYRYDMERLDKRESTLTDIQFEYNGNMSALDNAMKNRAKRGFKNIEIWTKDYKTAKSLAIKFLVKGYTVTLSNSGKDYDSELWVSW